MSATNWGTCPKCEEQKEKEKKAVTTYGTVSEDEYLATLNKHIERYKEVNNDLREDYEIGVDMNGKFSVWYSCGCLKCDFKFKYAYSQELLRAKDVT